MRFKHNLGVPTLWGSTHTYPPIPVTPESHRPQLLPTRTSGSGVSADFWS